MISPTGRRATCPIQRTRCWRGTEAKLEGEVDDEAWCSGIHDNNRVSDCRDRSLAVLRPGEPGYNAVPAPADPLMCTRSFLKVIIRVLRFLRL